MMARPLTSPPNGSSTPKHRADPGGACGIAILPSTLDVRQTATVLGISTDHAYQSIARGDFPIEVLRIGRSIRVPSRPLLEAVGLPEDVAVDLLGLRSIPSSNQAPER